MFIIAMEIVSTFECMAVTLWLITMINQNDINISCREILLTEISQLWYFMRISK